jgi:hypothetical protein
MKRDNKIEWHEGKLRMSVGRIWIELATKAGIGLGALCVVGVLLAAIPNHHVPAVSAGAAQDPQNADHANMPGMSSTEAEDTATAEKDAMHDMEHMHHGDTPHMHMTAPRTPNAEDQKRAEEIAVELRAAIAKYKDYHVALDEGFHIFLPNIKQPEYHFTNYGNAFLQRFTFDPARPTSLLYRKTASGYELVGAMYTMPRTATEEELNERIPLSVATWHLHTNLCVPPLGQRMTADYAKFGLRGSITTEQACDAAGGTFYPVILGWMVHVYPYEDSTAKMYAMHHMD